MRTGLPFSFVMHVALMVIAYYGLPSLRRDVMMETPIMIEVVTVAEITNALQPEVKPEKQAKVEESKPEPKPEPPAPVVKAAPPPTPEPQLESAPEPKPEEVAIVPPPPEAKPKARKKPKPKPKPKPKASAVLAKVKPKKKPKPPDAFASVLKTVADLKRQPAPTEKKPEKKKEKKEKPKASLEDQIAKALVSKKRSFDSSEPVTISEIDNVRQQITKCWNIQAGAKNAQDMIIEISVAMNIDGTVRQAKIKNKGMQSDPFLRAMAESALRAVLNKRCQPFKLPRDKFDRWKTMKLLFNPKKMLGG